MFENIRLSFQGIFSHKIRSFLTMLGIIIGIAAIIAIVSTIKGTNEQIKNNLIGAGNNTVNIQLSRGDYPLDFQYDSIPTNMQPISEETKQRINDLKEVESCTLYRTREMYQNIYYLNKSLESSTIHGIDEDYFETMGYTISQGKGFTEKDFTEFRKTAIIDDTLARSFSGEDPVGKIIDINGEPFIIIGIAVKNSSFEPVINSVDDYFTYYNQTSSGIVFIPTEDWGIVFRYDEPQNCVVRATNTDAMTNAGKKTADILNEYVPATDASASSEEALSAPQYKSESLLEKAKSLQELSNSTNSMLIWIASISLLVGGIGVMNIMLVSVTERTREIGLKKALGARKRRILGQFLTEAAVLTSIGGIIGVISGIGLAQVIAKVADVPVSISTPAIIISVVFSMVVGIVFGLIPSIKAAKLNPIDALRYE